MAAGVRRIEAITSLAAEDFVNEQEQVITSLKEVNHIPLHLPLQASVVPLPKPIV